MEPAMFSTTSHGFHDLLGFSGRSSSTKTPPLARLGLVGVQNRSRRRSGPLIQLGFGGAHSRRRKTGPLAQLRFPKQCDGDDGPLLQRPLAEKFNRRIRHSLLLGFAEKLNHRNGLLRFAEKLSKQDQPRPNLGFLGPLEFAGGCIRRTSTPLLQLRFLSICSRANKPLLGVGDNVCTRGKRVGYSHSSWSARPHQWLQLPSRIMSVSCRGRSGDFSADEFGPYPWDPSWHIPDNNAIEWIQEDIVTLFTSDGLIQIGGFLIPHKKKQSHGKAPFRYRRLREEDNYMNPEQDLCLGAIFDIVATNGLDMGRRFCVFGFCRSIEMLSDVVEDTVLEQGGEVVRAAKGNSGGLNEKLSMTVAVPLLWGVPPAVDSLNYAIRCGGGIVEKVSCQWEFL